MPSFSTKQDEDTASRRVQKKKSVKEFSSACFQESKDNWDDYCNKEVVPFYGETMDRNKLFHSLSVCLLSSDIETKISYDKFLQPFTEKSEEMKITVLTGESGLALVMKNIAQHFFYFILRDSDTKSLLRYDLVHYFECRDTNTTNLVTLIRNNFQTTTENISDAECLSYLRKLQNLFIIDRYDELNEYSRGAFDDILNAVTDLRSCNLLITIRPGNLSKLTTHLGSKNLQYRTYRVAPLSKDEDKINFLQNIAKGLEMKEEEFNSLKKNFSKIKDNVRVFLTQPIELIMLLYINKYNPNKVISWAGIADVAQDVYVLYSDKLRGMLDDDKHSELLMIVNELALSCIDRNESTIDREEQRTLSEKCYQLVSSQDY